jgi:hypothetical protein
MTPQALSVDGSLKSYQLLKQNRHDPRRDALLALRLSDQSLETQTRQIPARALTPP